MAKWRKTEVIPCKRETSFLKKKEEVSFILHLSLNREGRWGATDDIATSTVWLLFSSYGELRAKYNLTEPIPLQVEHVAVEFIVEPFRPSGPFLLPMKISVR